jgi:hypothetical protein
MRFVALHFAARATSRGLVPRTPARRRQQGRALTAARVPQPERRVALPLRTCFARALCGHVVAAAEVEEDDEPFEVDLQGAS